MNFSSDNVAGISPEILAALAAANSGRPPSYGEDPLTRRVERRLAEIFEHEVAVFPVATGTAANALALATLVPPWGAVYCHAEAHVVVDECGAPEFYAGGARMVGVVTPHGKVGAGDLAALLPGGKGVVHHMQPAAISLTQASEAGTVYRADEVAAIGALASRHGLGFHVDGARFANALVHLKCAPADITWRAGVDVLSFGATKNGAAAAEAVIFFDPAKAVTHSSIVSGADWWVPAFAGTTIFVPIPINQLTFMLPQAASGGLSNIAARPGTRPGPD